MPAAEASMGQRRQQVPVVFLRPDSAGQTALHDSWTQNRRGMGMARWRTDEDDAQAVADGVLRRRGIIDANVAGRRGATGQVIPDLSEAGQVRAEAEAPDCAKEGWPSEEGCDADTQLNCCR